jgi:23S rRNA pseudouridine1911/1915/1917 synthase
MNVSVLYEERGFIILNKPSGLMVHPDGKQDKKTLVDFILENYPEIKGVGEPLLIDGKEIDRPGIVHRLDEETSGAIIIARNQKSFLHLKEQFQNREISKEYHAFVWEHFKESEGVVDVAIGRNANDFRRWHAGRGVRGETREAVTIWKVQAQFENEQGEKFSFINLFPKTGRTHQLRVHMKYLQRPIVSDKLYAPTKPFSLGFNRVALHARKITFKDLEGKEVTIEAPYEEDFKAALAKYVNLPQLTLRHENHLISLQVILFVYGQKLKIKENIDFRLLKV